MKLVIRAGGEQDSYGGDVSARKLIRDWDFFVIDMLVIHPVLSLKMQIDQIAIAVLGALAAWLSQARAESFRRWACIFGMLGQPFWFYASWHSEQWGIFAVSVLYALAWMKGLWVHWLRPARSSSSIEKIGTIQLVPEVKK